MSVKANINHLKGAPRKARLVADMIRGKSVNDALNILRFTKKYVSVDFLKLVNQALANAGQKGGYDPDNLFVSKIEVNQGPTSKRFRPRSRGMASPLIKRTSHIKLELGER